jgi:hypothetical protein
MTLRGGPTILGVSQSLSDYVQVVSAPTGLVAFDLVFPSARDALVRAARGLIAQLAGGADAVLYPWYDPDRMGDAYIGFAPTASQIANGVPWSQDQPWSDLQNWALSTPRATMSAAAAKGATEIAIDVSAWNGHLDLGSVIGFDVHRGIYTVKWRTLAGSVATARIWPPLRRAVATGAAVTLTPEIAMTLASPQAWEFTRGVGHLESFTLSLREVPDEVLHTYGERPDGTTFP